MISLERKLPAHNWNFWNLKQNGNCAQKTLNKVWTQGCPLNRKPPAPYAPNVIPLIVIAPYCHQKPKKKSLAKSRKKRKLVVFKKIFNPLYTNSLKEHSCIRANSRASLVGHDISRIITLFKKKLIFFSFCIFFLYFISFFVSANKG